MLAVRVHKTGGPEVLTYETCDTPRPGDDEVLVRHTAIGLNFIDTYHRGGLYQLKTPFIPGTEAAGIVEETGKNVTDIKSGDRVAYTSHTLGCYAEKGVIRAARAISIPSHISDESAAAVLVKGMTAYYLLHQTYRVQAGETILVHAAAGGVGLILCAWAKKIGARVIGTVGSPEKAVLARAYGCDETIDYRKENFAERVREITGGQGVPVVYDSVGKDTFEGSLDCLAPRGMMVSYGNASGPVPAFEPLLLSRKGSLYLTRPSLWHYIEADEDYRAAADALMGFISSSKLDIAVGQRFSLRDAGEAHRALEARETSGASVLIP